MGISDILMSINKNYKLSDLTKLTKDNFKEFYPHTAKDFASYSELDEFLKDKGLKASNLYYNISMHNNCWYIDGEVILYIPYLMKFSLDMLDGEIVCTLQSCYDKAIQEKDWESYIAFKPETFRVDVFKSIIKESDIKNKADLVSMVKLVYGETNQIMYVMSKEELKDLLVGSGYKYKISKSDKLDSKGLMTIYRGETSESTSIEEALSYSKDINIACHFATFIKDEAPILHIGKVNPKDILLDIDEGEAEVLVDYENLRSLKTLRLYTLSDYYGEAERLFKKVGGLLHVADKRKGMHGVSHSERMLKLLCTMYVNDLKGSITEKEFNLLAIACCLHDIGRVNDHKDCNHGKNSLKHLVYVLNEAEKVGIGLSVNEDRALINILKSVVAYHCIDDKIALKHLEKDYPKWQLKDVVKMFSLFKDLDNLDRYRTKDFDAKYLRNDVAIKCVGVAKWFLTI